jgi:hypothetical protein
VACVALAVVAAAPVLGCGAGDKPPPTAAKLELAAQWQDAFDGTPELLVVVRPKALKRDAVYGSLWASALRAALARAPLAGTSGTELLEGCEEVILAVHRDRDTNAEDAAIVFRGVAASLEPGKLVDGGGRAVLRPLDARAKVPEYVPASPSSFTERGSAAARDVSLFVLPARTWVVATGGARARGRQAFATPTARPAPKVDEGALAVVRVGPELLVTPRSEKSPVLGPLLRKLRSASLQLDPAKAGVRLVLTYGDGDATAYGEMQVKRIAQGLAKESPGRFAWLADAKVSSAASSVTVAMPVPARLLEELPSASPADLGL